MSEVPLHLSCGFRGRRIPLLPTACEDLVQDELFSRRCIDFIGVLYRA